MLVSPIALFIEQQGFLLLDGALATELERHGADLHDHLWSAKIVLEAPALIRKVHYDYFVAGADLAISASYQVSFEGFAKRGLSREHTVQALLRSIALAAEARDQFWADPARRSSRLRPIIAASIGPYGAFLADGSEYRGDYALSIGELIDWHRSRLAVLSGSAADLLAFETIPCLTEARALIALLAEFPDTGAWLSFSCRDGQYLSSGEPFIEAVALAEACPQIVGVGVNCTAPEWITPLLQAASEKTGKYLLAYPNSGETWNAKEKCWMEGQQKTGMAEWAKIWYADGARLIGGCCRTKPEDIAAIRRALALKKEGNE